MLSLLPLSQQDEAQAQACLRHAVAEDGEPETLVRDGLNLATSPETRARFNLVLAYTYPQQALRHIEQALREAQCDTTRAEILLCKVRLNLAEPVGACQDILGLQPRPQIAAEAHLVLGRWGKGDWHFTEAGRLATHDATRTEAHQALRKSQAAHHPEPDTDMIFDQAPGGFIEPGLAETGFFDLPIIADDEIGSKLEPDMDMKDASVGLGKNPLFGGFDDGSAAPKSPLIRSRSPVDFLLG